MMSKPIRALELYCPMIQFLIKKNITNLYIRNADFNIPRKQMKFQRNLCERMLER